MQDLQARADEAVAAAEESRSGDPEPGATLEPEGVASEEDGAAESLETPCRFSSGIAGTGKTYAVRERIKADPRWGILSATTGIAAVNLDAITINSLLGYFDTDSLRDAYLTGRLARKLHELALDYRWLVIDEVSMMDAEQLQLLYRALEDANAYRDVKLPMGLYLVGDFAQLPPIKARWAFEADCWPRFAAATERLTKVWRQEQQEFLEALNWARVGNGRRAAEILSSVGVQWHTALDVSFEGTTIIPKNDQVDRFNQIALDKVTGQRITVTSRRWGKQRGEWRNVPERLELKLGAYVMMLANSPGDFAYVNGDCGHVEGYVPAAQGVPAHFAVRLVRTGEIVAIPRIVRDVGIKDEPEGWSGGKAREPESAFVAHPHRNSKGRFVQGQVEYFPLRLAYASTVHKSQGLSLDKTQIDFRHAFFKSPAMLYVALSRCRTLEGLRLVGQRERFVQQCNIDARIREFL
jgi:ATP-dependent DNA helicase PIF1